MKTIALILLTGLLACGGGQSDEDPNLGPVETVAIGEQNPQVHADEAEHTVTHNQRGEAYIEAVTPEVDELYTLVDQHPDLFPADRPLPLVPEIIHGLVAEKLLALREGRPMEVAKWHSAVFHGTTHNGSPCYAPNSNGTICIFPQAKNVQLVQGDATYGAFNCTAASLNGSGMSKATADVVMSEAIYAMGLQDRPGIGMGIRGNPPPPSPFLQVKLSCNSAEPSKMGDTWTSYHSQGSCQAGLPAHNGINPTCAMQSFVSNIVMYPVGLYNLLKNTCGYTATNLATNTTIFASFSHYIGTHELLHHMGFGHFTAGVMRANIGCDLSYQASSINSTTALVTLPFSSAVSIYSGGHENDDGILHDVGLSGPVDGDPEDSNGNLQQ